MEKLCISFFNEINKWINISTLFNDFNYLPSVLDIFNLLKITVLTLHR